MSRRCWKRAASVCLVVAALLGTGREEAAAQAAPPPEYQIKAVFLFHFAEFVEWPAAAFAGARAPLVIGVLGDDPFGAYLDETVRGESMNRHPMTVRRYERVEDVDACHILFVSRSEAERLGPVLGALRGRSILTVGDFEGFEQRGGMIRFVTEDNRIRLRIRVDVARAAGLTISSKLLRLADVVTAEEG